MESTLKKKRLAPWLRRSLPPRSAQKTHGVLRDHGLNTVCESALCPNRSECYANDTATFMILGDVCTRRCGFCAIEAGKPAPLDAGEPDRVARAVERLGLKYVVLTSVARDDLADEGAGHFAATVRSVYRAVPRVQVEVLTPDFHARPELLQKIVDTHPTVYNHNLETVERLQKKVRPQAGYARSLRVLETIKALAPGMTTKSGLMLGLGETVHEVAEAARDLRTAGVEILTLGQYLPPGENYLPAETYVRPDVFRQLADQLRDFGFREVFAGPYVRSSYHAGETFLKAEALR